MTPCAVQKDQVVGGPGSPGGGKDNAKSGCNDESRANDGDELDRQSVEARGEAAAAVVLLVGGGVAAKVVIIKMQNTNEDSAKVTGNLLKSTEAARSLKEEQK